MLLRTMDLRWRVICDHARDDLTLRSLLRRRIDARLQERVQSARSTGRLHDPFAWAGDEDAWFASEAIFTAEVLVARARGGLARWPYASRFASERAHAAWSQPSAPDVLAHLVRRLTARGDAASPLGDAEALARAVDAHVAADLAARWSLDAADLRDLPAHVSTAVQPYLRFSDDAPPELAPLTRLLAVGKLFEVWPPLRSRDQRMSTRAPRARAAHDVDSSRAAETRSTSALGLVYWASMLGEDGLGDALHASYPEPRAHRMALLALAVALDDPRIALDDPLLLSFAGEPPSARIWLGAAEDLDPEPLRASAVRDAARDERRTAHLFEVGDQWFALLGEIPIDGGVGRASEAVERIVTDLRGLTGRTPCELRVHDDGVSELAARVVEVDAPRLEGRWRVAARAMAAVLVARARREGLEVSDLRFLRAELTCAGSEWRVRPLDAIPEPVRAMLRRGLELGGRRLSLDG